MENDRHHPQGLTKQIGLLAALAVVIGEVVGVGIFLNPAGLAKSLASPGWILVVWLVMIVLSLCGAICYGELARRLPHAGGGYVYLRESFGPAVAFLYGWKSLLVLDPGLTAAWAMGVGQYSSALVGLSQPGQRALGCVVILAVALLSMLGVRASSRALILITGLKIVLLAAIIMAGFMSEAGDWGGFVPFWRRASGDIPMEQALAGGFVTAFFCLGGWWDLNKLSAEVRDPARTLPRALVLGILLVGLFYVMVSAVFFYLAPRGEADSREAFVQLVGERLFGRLGAEAFAGMVIICVLGSLLSYLMAAPRVYYAMARDGLFFSRLSKLHPRLQTPTYAIGVQAILAILLVAMGTFDAILTYFIFVTVLFLGLSVVGLIVLRRREPTGNTILGLVCPILFLACIAMMLTLLLIGSPMESLAGLGVVASGLPIYYLFKRKRI